MKNIQTLFMHFNLYLYIAYIHSYYMINLNRVYIILVSLKSFKFHAVIITVNVRDV